VKGVSEVIESMKGDAGCVFVKTSCRSAKDTSLYSTKFKEAYVASIAKRKEDSSFNSKVIGLLEAGLHALKTYDAESLFSTFLISERVFEDFELALLRKERWEQNLAVRQWTNIDVDMEFRGFVKNGKLNAISQYNYVAYFPRLKELHEKLTTSITKFFYDVCLPAVGTKYNDFIIDFGIVGKNFDEILVIELNEFMDTTDGCMFKWKTDRELLEKGPFTFRIVEDPIPESVQLTFLSQEWLNIIKDN